jgi:methylated-DNA-protein-cysteine methyltransferase related protein
MSFVVCAFSCPDYNRCMPKTKRTDTMFARIRETIMRIPRGKVSSYGAVGLAAGYPRSARIVVRVLGQSHGLPWHRVVAAGGRIATPGEHGLDQRFRLEMEGVKFSGRKVRMVEFEHQFPRKAKSSSTKKIAKKSSATRKKSIQKKSSARKKSSRQK